MELFVVIAIIGLAAVYIVKTFYNKYKIGKAGGSGCGCASCDTKGTLCGQPDRPQQNDFLACESGKPPGPQYD